MSDNLPACSAKYQYSSKKVKVFVFSKLSVLNIRGKTSYEIELNIINKITNYLLFLPFTYNKIEPS